MFKKGLVVIAVPFLFQFVFLAALWKTQNESMRAQDWAIHTKDVIAQVELVGRSVTEAQNDVRGVIVTGDLGLSQAYDRASRRVPASVAKLQELVKDNQAQQARAVTLGARIRGFMVGLADAHRLARAGRIEEASARVRAMAEAQTAEKIRALLDSFLNQEERLYALRRSRLEATWRTQSAAIVSGAVASVAVAVMMILAFSRGFTRRIAVLSENARRIAEGKVLAEPIGGGDELARLDSVFHAMAASLAEKDLENEMFIFSVSHDLRSPLVNLQGFSRELALSCEDLRGVLALGGVAADIRKRVDVVLDHDMGTSIRFIQTAVTRLSSIIDALLRLSRAGRVEYRRQPVDVAGAVARVVEAMRSTVSDRKAEIIVGELPAAYGDPTAVEQVFANLVGNALNYLDPARPGRVEIGAADPDEIPGARTGSKLIVYHVKDNGLGIPKAYQAKIFQAFQRLHPEAAEGEGIGLALVRRVVERHGGKVWFESEAGVGSTFYVALPAPAGLAPGCEHAGPSGSENGREGTRVWPITTR